MQLPFLKHMLPIVMVFHVILYFHHLYTDIMFAHAPTYIFAAVFKISLVWVKLALFFRDQEIHVICLLFVLDSLRPVKQDKLI